MKLKTDEFWMSRALHLAERGWGMTSPNPMVGAVIIRNGICVGEGYHERAGQPHAEINALRAAGDSATGGEMYVTLEPCCTFGRTPPCTEAIKRSGLRRVVVGCVDPNPAHAGRGIDCLREAGVEVEVGIAAQECGRLNEAFFHWIRTRRPFVLLKMAMTLDGRIATSGGQSKWITGAAARQRVQRLRQWADAIMVGASTVRADDPALTVRAPADWPRQPLKIVWTRRHEAFGRELRIFADTAAPPRFVSVSDKQEWNTFLTELGNENITALLLEGGGELASCSLRAGAVDKVMFFMAPTILGGRAGCPVVGGPDPESLSQALRLRDTSVEQVEDDFLITGYTKTCLQD